MGKAFGIAAFVFLLVSFPIPIVGTYITFIALALATLAAVGKETVWTMTVVVIAAVKLFFLSPTWHVLMFPPHYGTTPTAIDQMTAQSSVFFLALTGLFLAAPVAVLVVRSVMAAQAAPAPNTDAS